VDNHHKEDGRGIITEEGDRIMTLDVKPEMLRAALEALAAARACRWRTIVSSS